MVSHIRVDTSDARVDRLWNRVATRLAPPRRLAVLVRWGLWPTWTRWAGATASVCVLAGGILIARTVARRPAVTTPASAWDGARLETADDNLSVTLVDGSSVSVAPRSRIDVGHRTAAAVKLVLVRGRMACDVTHHPERSFLVVAGGVEVRVVGTRFSVSTERNDESTRTEVQVERGVVEVRGAGPGAEIVRVPAGRTWSQVTKTAALVAPTGKTPGPAVVEAATEATEQGTAAEPAPSQSASASPEAPAGANDDRSRMPVRAASRLARPGAPAGARQLLEQARALWRQGQIGDAAAAYQSLLSEHPGDPRAGLAAFELGRLRMDRLRDMEGAVRALERAVALAPGAGFREDAMARLVTASAGAGDRGRCERARDRYLASYPAGVHRRTVAAACPAEQ